MNRRSETILKWIFWIGAMCTVSFFFWLAVNELFSNIGGSEPTQAELANKACLYHHGVRNVESENGLFICNDGVVTE